MARLPFPLRAVLVIILALVLTASSALEAQPGSPHKNRQVGFIAAAASELRVQWWNFLNGFWEKAGCVADPHGVCKAGLGGTMNRTVQETAGCIADSNGGCPSSR